MNRHIALWKSSVAIRLQFEREVCCDGVLLEEEGRYKPRSRKEKTPEQLQVLAMAREKAQIVIQEKAKLKKQMETPEEPVESPAEEPLPPPPSLSREEVSDLIQSAFEQRQAPKRKYEYINGITFKKNILACCALSAPQFSCAPSAPQLFLRSQRFERALDQSKRRIRQRCLGVARSA